MSILIPVHHFAKGRLVEGVEREFRSRDLDAGFSTPALDLTSLVWPRTEIPPAADVPVTISAYVRGVIDI